MEVLNRSEIRLSSFQPLHSIEIIKRRTRVFIQDELNLGLFIGLIIEGQSIILIGRVVIIHDFTLCDQLSRFKVGLIFQSLLR